MQSHLPCFFEELARNIYTTLNSRHQSGYRIFNLFPGYSIVNDSLYCTGFSRPSIEALLELGMFFRPRPWHYAGGIWKRNNRRSFWIYVEKTSVKKSHHYCDFIIFEKFHFQNVPHLNAKPFSNSSGSVELERFRKAPFSQRISVDGRPNHRNKAAFRISQS